MSKNKTNNKVSVAERRLKQKREQISKICSVASAAFFSFFVLFVFTDYTNITAVKYNTFWVMTALLGVVYLIEKGGMLLEGNLSLKTGKLNYLPYIFSGGFLIFSCLSAVLSPFSGTLNEKGQSMLFFGDKRYDGLFVIILYIILFLIFSFENSFGKYFTRVVTYTLAATTLVAVMQLLGFNFLGFFPSHNFYVYEKFISTVGNIDMVSALYCILLPIIALSYITEEQKNYLKVLRLCVYTLSVFVFWEIFVDSGRVAFVALLFVAFNLLFFKRDWYLKFFNILMLSAIGILLSNIIVFSYDKQVNKLSITLSFESGSLIWLGVLVLAAALGCVYKYLIPENKIKLGFGILAGVEIIALVVILYWILNFADSSHGTVYEFAEILKGRGKEGFGSARYGLWKYTLELANERFLIGHGAGTYRNALVEYTTGVSARYSRGIFDFAHNEFLQIYYNSGIFGLISYVGLVGTLVIRGIKNSLKNNKVLILTLAMLCYLVQSFFMFSIIIVAPLFWIIAGMLCYEIRNTKI